MSTNPAIGEQSEGDRSYAGVEIDQVNGAGTMVMHRPLVMHDSVERTGTISERSAVWQAHVAAQLANGAASGDLLAGSLSEMLGDLAVANSGGAAQWRRAFALLISVHPQSDVRCRLAADGPLAVLRRLVHDPDVRVRYSALFNPLVSDAEVQLALASDPDDRVVDGLLGVVTPTVEAARIIAASQHSLAKRRLACMRVSTETLMTLAEDADLVTRTIARRRVGSLGRGRAVLELGAGQVESGVSTWETRPVPPVQLSDDVEVLVHERRSMSRFQERLYAERAGLSREEALPWWELNIHSGEVAAAIAAGRTPQQEVERRETVERDRWICSTMAQSESSISAMGLGELMVAPTLR